MQLGGTSVRVCVVRALREVTLPQVRAVVGFRFLGRKRAACVQLDVSARHIRVRPNPKPQTLNLKPETLNPKP